MADFSLYDDGTTATTAEITEAMKRLADAFPKQPKQFWQTFSDVAHEDGWSYAKLECMVRKVIRSHNYSTLTMADILGADEKITMHDHLPAQTAEEVDNWIMLDNGKYISKEDYLLNPDKWKIKPSQYRKLYK